MAAYDPKKVQSLSALGDSVIVYDMNFDEMKTQSGIIIQSDDGKSHGVKPRWGKVYKVGPLQTDVKEGEWILVEHGRWSRGMDIDDGGGVKTIRKVDVKCILASANEKPNDFYIGEEIGSTSSSIRPEDFQ